MSLTSCLSQADLGGKRQNAMLLLIAILLVKFLKVNLFFLPKGSSTVILARTFKKHGKIFLKTSKYL